MNGRDLLRNTSDATQIQVLIQTILGALALALFALPPVSWAQDADATDKKADKKKTPRKRRRQPSPAK